MAKMEHQCPIYTFINMACFSISWSSSLPFLISLFICLIIRTAVADPVYVYSLCPDSQTVAPNSTYQTNVDALLSSLSSNNTNESRFYNTTVGSGADRVYGVFSCRMDQTTVFCQQCLSLAINSLNAHCHGKEESIVWYDQCLVRYSNESFFGSMNDSPMIALWNTPNAVDIQNITSNQTAFMQTLAETLGVVAYQVETALPAERFATTEGRFVDNLTNLSMVYTLAECTPDISSSDCQSCLQMTIGNMSELCNMKAGCTLMNPNCYMRYDIRPFYGDANTASSGLSPVPQFRETPAQNASISRHRRTLIIASVTISAALAMLILFVAWIFLSKRKLKKTICAEANGIETADSLKFNFSTIRKATNDFSSDRKLGEGGFGEVYKGKLANGQDVAIKRLSKTSKQGIDEFKTEVMVVAKLQHRNLVKLLGFCVSVKEKILVYEYLSNSSLDRFLSDPKKRASLCWRTRFQIIEGIAKGLLYLHEDSRLKIVHRDLKSSNILLDEAMNPKIADFGMAKLFGVDQTQDNTNRIVGTLGYMAPEYLIAGHFSVKSDVYSFGVIVLEIVSGLCIRQQRNDDDDEESLIYRAWRLWDEGISLKLADSTLGNDFPVKEMAKCIQIGLLCVQEDSAKRPKMTSIVAALNGESITLPLPTLPRFLTDFTADGVTEAFSDQSFSSCRPVQKTTDVDAR